MRLSTLVVSGLLVLVGCAEEDASNSESPETTTLTYHADIAPIIQAEARAATRPIHRPLRPHLAGQRTTILSGD